MNNLVAVTGSAGFIGGHLLEYLHRLGRRVVCFDKRSMPYPLPEDVSFEQPDP